MGLPRKMQSNRRYRCSIMYQMFYICQSAGNWVTRKYLEIMETIVLRFYTPGSRRLVLTGLLHLRLADGGFCGRLLGCRPRRMPVCQGSVWQCFYRGCFIYASWSWNWNRKSWFSILIIKNVTLINNRTFRHLKCPVAKVQPDLY